MTAQFEEEHDETMEALLRALETAPAVDVPADFTARVMARVPQHARVAGLRRARALTPRYGRAAAFIGLGMLLVTMLFVSSVTGNSSVGAALQLLLLVQLCAYALWIGTASWRRR